MPGSFMPAFASQPFFQTLQVDLRVISPKPPYVRLEAFRIKPAKHLVELLSQQKPHKRHGQLLELDWLAEHAAENLRCLDVGQLAACNLQFQADEILRALESQRDKGADIVGGDRLVRFISTDRVHELPLQNPDLYLINVVILHERCRPNHGRAQPEFADVLFDLPFALKMINA